MKTFIEEKTLENELIGTRFKMNDECFAKVKSAVKVLRDLGAFSVPVLLGYINELYENSMIDEQQSDALCITADPMLSCDDVWGEPFGYLVAPGNPLENVAEIAWEDIAERGI